MLSVFRSSIPLLFLAAFLVAAALGQTPTQTGRVYSSELQRPTNPAPQYPSPVAFSEITPDTTISFRHQASPTSQKYLLETMGAGVAVFDFDNDGRLDIFLTNGAHLADPMPKGKLPDKSDPKFWNRLYRQRSDGKFEDVTDKSGLRGEGYAFGVAVGDYDKDGNADLFVTHYGGATLYRNNGDASFSNVTARSRINVEGWPASAGFFDYDNDGRLDLFVTRYVVWDFEKGSLFCGDLRPGRRSYCHPDNFDATTSLLYHQRPDGTFEDVSERAGISKSKGKALGVAFADFNNDGWTDIFVANDTSEQQLFRNIGGGRFEDVAVTAGVAFNENGNRFSGMGVDVADYDNDGLADIVITVLSNETYPLYRNRGEWFFDYVTQVSGVGQISVLNTGWGVKFIDVDNDGRRDIFAAQGHVLDTIETMNNLLKYRQPPLLVRNAGKEFQDVSFSAGAVFRRGLAARGMATGDLDNDGDPDVVIAQTDGPVLILRNDGGKLSARNNWIGFALRGRASAPRGEGARIVVTDSTGKKQIFDVSNSGSYLAANDDRLLVGLGESVASEVQIRWPSGKIQTLEKPAVGRYHEVREK